MDRQHAHVQKDKIARAYDRAQFLEERKKMMQRWADYFDGVEGGAVIAERFGKSIA
ncbi:hypothetical protein [Undibacterium umbellatum]|uniref:Integrase n=1 Tax=Undibacterium umbellatum TaxID=2762300 RepID=A0ABR6ZBC0_9BURK|nr:hypothetical protein [Undibacterium umbellatum]MBC3909028.1 hypothetical protein [Undibacterium umbellatum]